MHRFSNNLSLLNYLTFMISIPILWAGIWLRHQGASECEKFLDTPVIVLGVFLLAVSLAGFIGSCCGVPLLVWIYLVVMFLLIVLLFCFTIVTFVVTSKGAGKVLSDKGYKEYKLGDYSNWLQKRVTSEKKWSKIKSCLINSKTCSDFQQRYLNDSLTVLYTRNLSALQAGCCKPPDGCGFAYQIPTTWVKTATSATSDPDCNSWDNQPEVLCFNCNSCKAGLLDNLRRDWKVVAVINIIFLILLIIVYYLACWTFRIYKGEDPYYAWWNSCSFLGCRE